MGKGMRGDPWIGVFCWYIGSFIGGTVMWLYGCNPDVAGGCLTKHVIGATVSNISLLTSQCCKSCACGKSTCCCGGTSCYGYDIWMNSDEGFCTSWGGGPFTTPDAALGETKYTIGQRVKVLREEVEKRCDLNVYDYKLIWIFGIVFLCIFASMNICLLVACYQNICRKSTYNPEFVQRQDSTIAPENVGSNIDLDIVGTTEGHGVGTHEPGTGAELQGPMFFTTRATSAPGPHLTLTPLDAPRRPSGAGPSGAGDSGAGDEPPPVYRSSTEDDIPKHEAHPNKFRFRSDSS